MSRVKLTNCVCTLITNGKTSHLYTDSSPIENPIVFEDNPVW